MEQPLATFNAICARVLQMDEDKIVDELSPTSAPSWDSFNALTLISELEQELGVHFTQKEVRSIKNIGEIKTLLRIRGLSI